MAKVEVSVEKILSAFIKTASGPRLTIKDAEIALDCCTDICRDCGLCDTRRCTITTPQVITVSGEAAGQGTRCDLVGLGLEFSPFPLPEGTVPASKTESDSDAFRNNLTSQIG